MKPSLCLTFDDLRVQNWLAARPIFDRFQARVTFCISHIHTATDADLKGLRQLQDDGHEIAYHSRTHPKLKLYLEQYSLDQWIAEELDQGIHEHRELGFPANSFACPFHSFTSATLTACRKRFAVTRAGGPRAVNEKNLHRRIYDPRTISPVVHNIGFLDMQHRAFPGVKWQLMLLDQISQSQGVGVLVGHDIYPQAQGMGFYSTHEQLDWFLQCAMDWGFGFRTLSGFENFSRT